MYFPLIWKVFYLCLNATTHPFIYKLLLFKLWCLCIFRSFKNNFLMYQFNFNLNEVWGNFKIPFMWFILFVAFIKYYLNYYSETLRLFRIFQNRAMNSNKYFEEFLWNLGAKTNKPIFKSSITYRLHVLFSFMHVSLLIKLTFSWY